MDYAPLNENIKINIKVHLGELLCFPTLLLAIKPIDNIFKKRIRKLRV